MIWDNDVRGHRFEEWTSIRDSTSIWVYHIYISVDKIYIPELVIPIMISVIYYCFAANTEATGPMNYWWLRHHFESFIVPALIWSTFVEYQCHKWPRYVPLVVITIRFCPHSWLITGHVTRITRRVTLEEQELFTRAEHLSSSPNLNCLCGVRVVCGVKLHVFMCFVLCCDVRCDFCVTRCSVRLFKGIRVLFMLYVFNYINCCPPLFPY